MRRIPVALALAMALILGSTATAAIGAGKNQPAGGRLDIRLGDQNYAASTAFHIYHGFGFEVDVANNAIGRYGFTLDMDGAPRAADFFLISKEPGFQLVKLWYFNFPGGLTDSHTFVGHWWQPCDNAALPCNGAKMHTPVEIRTESATVTFS